jgi:hypothetical protein
MLLPNKLPEASEDYRHIFFAFRTSPDGRPTVNHWGVLAIVSKSLSLIQTLNGCVNKYQMADFEVSSMLAQCGSVSVALFRV